MHTAVSPTCEKITSLANPIYIFPHKHTVLYKRATGYGLPQVDDMDAQQIPIKVTMHNHREEACRYSKTPFKTRPH